MGLRAPSLLALALTLAVPALARAQAEEAEPPPYRTPRAGDRFETEVFGRKITVDARDRREATAITLGATFFDPSIGDNRVIPFAAFYLWRVWDERRVRAVLSGLVNEADYQERLTGTYRLALHGETRTIPFPTTEILDGEDQRSSAVYTGELDGWIGLGWHVPVAPFAPDNELSAQLFYEGGYQYFLRAHDTADGLEVPHNTYVHGLRARVRLDKLERNLLELPHLGLAFGSDAEIYRRDRWRGRTRDGLKLSGYAVLAMPIPPLSERHRLLGYVHAGWSPAGHVDRYSGFRIGGGPIPTESSDLARSPYPGAMFDQMWAERFLIFTIEYRLELLFFLYLHVRGTLAWGRVPTLDGTPARLGPERLVDRHGESLSVALTSGFLWDSLIDLDWTFDTGALRRGGRAGHTVLFTWSKGF